MYEITVHKNPIRKLNNLKNRKIFLQDNFCKKSFKLFLKKINFKRNNNETLKKKLLKYKQKPKLQDNTYERE